MSPLLTVVVWLLIPAGLLPVFTAWELRRYRHTTSPALRDRGHLSLVLAVLGLTVTFLSANAAFGWGIRGEVVALPFAVVLLAVDLLSGKWLIDYWTGAFDSDRETDIQREDREAGDKRRSAG